MLDTPKIPDEPLTISIIGAGERGNVYASYAQLYPRWLRVVAVAENHDGKREQMVQKYGIPPENVFHDWKEMADKPRISDAVAICTPDKLHMEPAVAFANLKYHILLEKPMAVTLEDCQKIVDAVDQNGVMFTVGHVLRYTKYMSVVMDILNSRALGDIINVQHLEPVGFWHFSHSFVRGNWNNEATSTFSLMSKSCHDLDLIPYMFGSKCTKISSFGSLSHFRKENKPKAAGDALNCLNCNYEPSCPYSAKKIYIEPFLKQGLTAWPNSVVQPNGNIDIENLTGALRDGNYGKCVYESENDVCDHQVVSFEFENGSTATFNMVACTEQICKRQIRIFGSKGEMTCDFGSDEVQHYDFLTREKKIINTSSVANDLYVGLPTSGHGGGDFALIRSFIYACVSGRKEHILTGPQETLDSHIYVFAAEEARRNGTVVTIQEFKQRFITN